MLNPNVEILEHEQEWTCPSTGVTYYRTLRISRTIDPDYGADADGNRGVRAAFYELKSVGRWENAKGAPLALNKLKEHDWDSLDEQPTPQQICERLADTDEW